MRGKASARGAWKDRQPAKHVRGDGKGRGVGGGDEVGVKRIGGDDERRTGCMLGGHV